MSDALSRWDATEATAQSALERWDTASASPNKVTAKPAAATGEKPGKIMSLLAGAGEATGRGAMAVQQLLGKGVSAVGDLVDSDTAKGAGAWLEKDAVAGAKKLEAENAPYREANPASNIGGQVAGFIASPINKVIPGGGASATVVAAGAKGAAQGAALNALTSPVTEGNFLWEKLKQGGLGAVGGLGGGTLGYGAGKLFDKAVASFQRLGSKVTAGNTGEAADGIVQKTLGELGLPADAVKADRPALFEGLRSQVKEALDAGKKIDSKEMGRLAQAQTLPVPVPMLKGQLSRDPMQYAKEQNLRGINGVGEPIQATLKAQNTALVANLDAIGAKDAPDVVSAGKTVIDALKGADKTVSGEVSAAYKAFKATTGKDLDVPLKGLAQDYAATEKEFGEAIPSAIRRKFEDLGLSSGTTKKVFSIEDAEGLIKSINRNYDPANRVQARALDDLRKSVQKAISEGAGEGSVGEAATLAKAARTAASKRFGLIEETPGLKAALHGEQPDKFIQRFVLQGNTAEIKSMVDTLGKHNPQALAELQNAVVGHIKGRVTGMNEQGAFSQDKLKQFVSDPNMAARLKVVLGPEKLGLLKQLNAVAENALYAPVSSAVNRSNTASAAANIVKSEVEGGSLNKIADLISHYAPVLSTPAQSLKASNQAARAGKLIDSAVNPSLGQQAGGAVVPLRDLPAYGQRAGTAYVEERSRRKAHR